jgi:hypothetical protein
MFIRASDVEDHVDDTADDAADQVDDAADDAADDSGAQDPIGEDGGEADAGVDAAKAEAEKKRRAIEARAAERRDETARIASEAAAATARETARAAQQASAQAEADRVEREALAAMTDDQKAIYQLAKQTKTAQDGITQMRAMTQSASDQSKFDRLLTRKPQFEKYADEVDRRHQTALNGGAFVPREAILAHLIGEQTLKSERVQGQKDAAQRRVRDARGNTGRAARGDSTGRANTGKSIVQRAEEADWAI